MPKRHRHECCFVSVRKLCSFPFAFLLAVRNKINQSRIFQPWLFNLLEPFWFRNHYFFFVDEGPLYQIYANCPNHVSVNFGLMSVFMVQVCLFTLYVQGNQTLNLSLNDMPPQSKMLTIQANPSGFFQDLLRHGNFLTRSPFAG